MSQNQHFNQFTIIEQSDQQIKIIAPNLFSNKERINILQTVLLMREAIQDVKIKPETNTVSIDYNSNKLPQESLLDILSTVLKNFDQKPQKNTEKKHIKQGRTEKKTSFKVQGMSCNSCALFLEMVLSRNPEIMHVSINYKSKKGIVKSFLKQDDIIHLIEKNGYRAHSFNIVP
jgi:Cu+-exporting ATPase